MPLHPSLQSRSQNLRCLLPILVPRASNRMRINIQQEYGLGKSEQRTCRASDPREIETRKKTTSSGLGRKVRDKVGILTTVTRVHEF